MTKIFPPECDIFRLLSSSGEETRLGGGTAAKRKGMSEMLQVKCCLVNKVMRKEAYLDLTPLQTAGAFLSSSAHTFFLTLSFVCPHIPLLSLSTHRFPLTLLKFLFLLFSEILSLPDTYVWFGFIWVWLITPGFHLSPTENRSWNSTTIAWLESRKSGCSVPFPSCSI